VETEPAENEADLEPAAPPPQRKERVDADVLPIGARAKPNLGGRIDLNRATADEAAQATGHRPKLSERIIETRSKRLFRVGGRPARSGSGHPARKPWTGISPFPHRDRRAEKAALAR